jgi:hypothetical protein
MISDSFELRPPSSIRGKEQFLKNYRIYGETNAARGFSGKQLGR